MRMWDKLMGKKETESTTRGDVSEANPATMRGQDQHCRDNRNVISAQFASGELGQLLVLLVAGTQTQQAESRNRLESLLFSDKGTAVASLWEMLRSNQTHARVKIEIAALLMRYDQKNRPRVRAMLLDALKRGSSETKKTISELLTGDGTKWTDPECVSAVKDYVVGALQSEHPETRKWAAHRLRYVIGRRDLEVPAIMAILFDALTHGEQAVRDDVAIVLDRCGVSATPDKMLIIVSALRQTGSDVAAMALIDMIKCAKSEAAPAIDVLADIVERGTVGKNMIEQIQDAHRAAGGGGAGTLLIGFTQSLAEKAASALAAIGTAAIPALSKILRAPNPAARTLAADALREIGPAAASAEGALAGLLSDEDWGVRVAAAWTLAQFCPRLANKVVQAMLPGLRHPSWVIRGRSAIILGLLGPSAHAAIPVLQAMRNDQDTAVAGQARDALAKLQKR